MNRPFGRRIVEQVRTAEDAGFRSRIDDGGARLHAGHGGAGHVEVADDVGLQGLLQLAVFEIGDVRATLLECRIVDQHVEASELLDRTLDDPLAVGRIAHVTGPQQAAASFLLHGAARGLGVGVFAQIGDGDVGAFACKQDGDGATDAGIAAGDDGDLSFQLFAAEIVRRVMARLQVEVGFDAGFGQMLLRHRIDRLPARAGLDRLLLVLLRLGGTVGGLRNLGDFALPVRGFLCALRGFFFRCGSSWRHGAAPSWSH